MSPTLQTKGPRLLENVKEKPDGRVSGRKAGTHEIRTVTISSAIIIYSSRRHTSFTYKEVYASGVHEGMYTMSNTKYK